MKNNPEFNVRFVKLIEKYPSIYNYTVETRRSKKEMDKIWKDIAYAFNETVPNCMAKWTGLKNTYIRLQKENGKGGAPNGKPHYLSNCMQFLLPYIKQKTEPNVRFESVVLSDAKAKPLPANRNGSGDTPSAPLAQKKNKPKPKTPVEQPPPPPPSTEGIPLEGELYYPKQEGFFLEPSYSYLPIPQAKKNLPKNKKKPLINEKNSIPECIQKSPDMAFFQSILPLISKLSDTDKIRFRISAMQTLQRLVEKDKDRFPHLVGFRPFSPAQQYNAINRGCSHPAEVNADQKSD